VLWFQYSDGVYSLELPKTKARPNRSPAAPPPAQTTSLASQEKKSAPPGTAMSIWTDRGPLGAGHRQSDAFFWTQPVMTTVNDELVVIDALVTRARDQVLDRMIRLCRSDNGTWISDEKQISLPFKGGTKFDFFIDSQFQNAFFLVPSKNNNETELKVFSIHGSYLRNEEALTLPVERGFTLMTVPQQLTDGRWVFTERDPVSRKARVRVVAPHSHPVRQWPETILEDRSLINTDKGESEIIFGFVPPLFSADGSRALVSSWMDEESPFPVAGLLEIQFAPDFSILSAKRLFVWTGGIPTDQGKDIPLVMADNWKRLRREVVFRDSANNRFYSIPLPDEDSRVDTEKGMAHAAAKEHTSPAQEIYFPPFDHGGNWPLGRSFHRSFRKSAA
jgi:hypothetical protein